MIYSDFSWQHQQSSRSESRIEGMTFRARSLGEASFLHMGGQTLAAPIFITSPIRHIKGKSINSGTLHLKLFHLSLPSYIINLLGLFPKCQELLGKKN